MEVSRLFLAQNVRFLRGKKKLSQESLAYSIQIPRFRLQYLESGKGKNIDPHDILKLSVHFGVNVDTLLKTDIRTLSNKQLEMLIAGDDIYQTGTNLRILSISIDKENEENMEYVPIRAKAGYVAGYNDPVYIASLPRFSLPNLPKGSTWRMFPIRGDSMLPIPDGSDVVCRFVQNWRNIKPKSLCIIIMKNEQDFVFKQVTLDNDFFVLESMNKVYKPYRVQISEVLEVWEFYQYQATSLPEMSTDMEGVVTALRELRNEIQQMKLELSKK